MDDQRRKKRAMCTDKSEKKRQQEIRKLAGTGEQLSNPLSYAGEYHRRKARRAAIKRSQWIDTGCAAMMIFEDFRQQGERNKIRRRLGLEPLFLPGEGRPQPA